MLFSNFTSVSPVQPVKIQLPNDVTDLGIVTDLRLRQLLKADCPIETRFLPNVRVSSMLQPLNARSPMLVTLLGIIMLVIAVQPEKAY